MMADRTIHKVNDAADAICDARAMVWALFHIAQGMRQDEVADAITACCNQAIVRLNQGSELLDVAAADLRGEVE
jgi:hypothetical protein